MSNFNSNQQNQPAWEPNVFNDDKLTMKGKALQEGGWNTRLRLKQKENNPCLEVSTGLKDKRDRQIRHEVPMSPRVLEELLYVVEVVANYKAAVSFELENWGYTWKWDAQANKSTRSDAPEIICKISIHRNDAGIVGIDFAFRGGKTIVPFVFEADEFHKWMTGGNYMSDGDQSKISALAWAKTIREVFAQMYVKEWTEPEWQKRSRLERMQRATGQGGGDGYNSNRQSGGQRQQGGGFNQPPAGQTGAFDDNFGTSMGFDDDIPL